MYIDELPSGVRTITGVATSITAFIGRALRGPVDEAVTITSYADFERIYGGLWIGQPARLRRRDFYPRAARSRSSCGVPVKTTIPRHRPRRSRRPTWAAAPQLLKLRAASPGAWGTQLTATLDNRRRDHARHAVFNLTVTDTATAEAELFRNVSFASGEPRGASTSCSASESTPRAQVVGTLPTAAQPSAAATATADRRQETATPIDAPSSRAGTDSRTKKLGLYALEDVDLVNLIVIPPYTATRRARARPCSTDAIAYATRAAGGRDHGSRRRALPGRRGRRARPRSRRSRRAATPPSTSRASASPTRCATASSPPSRRRAPSPASSPARTRRAASGRRRPASTRRSTASPSSSVPLTDLEIGQLNPLGVNCLRAAPGAGHVVWGARTRDGNDRLASRVEVPPGAAHGAVHRGVAVPRHAVGRLRAQRRAAVGADPAQRRRVHEQPVPPGRVRRARRRRRPTSSSATRRPRPRTTSTSASSTSSSASRR